MSREFCNVLVMVCVFFREGAVGVTHALRNRARKKVCLPRCGSNLTFLSNITVVLAFVYEGLVFFSYYKHRV